MESIAVRNKRICHSENEPHFFRLELEEFYNKLRNEIHFPALIVEGYEIGYDDDQKNRNTSFIVVQCYEEQNDYDRIFEAFSECEDIGEEIIRKVNNDDEMNSCASFELSNAILLQNETERYVGIRFSIRVTSKIREDIDKSMWIDE